MSCPCRPNKASLGLGLALLVGLTAWLALRPAASDGSRAGPPDKQRQDKQRPDKPYDCRRATGQLQIDGKADEDAWRRATTLDHFTAHWAGQPARSATKARLLWDDQYLYFFAQMDDRDLYADIDEHDAMTWLNDVFELFFKPARDQLGYYEFQVNAANTTMDMYLPSRGSGGYARWKAAHPFNLQTAVVTDGTLGDWQDTDRGWSAEGRIPWSDFSPTGGKPGEGDEWTFSLSRYDYSTAYDRADLSASAPLTRGDFHNYEDYSPLRFVR